MQFAVALSRQIDTDAAALEVAAAIRTRLSGTPIDLVGVFFSAHHAEGADRLAEMLTGTLRPRLLLGCSGEGVIAGAEELETAPAITAWAAVLPDVNLHPLQSSFSPTQDQFHLTGWPAPGVDDGTFLLLADPFTTPVQDILGIVDDRYPGAQAIGGLAGGGQEAGMNRLVLNDQAFEGGLVGVRLSGAVDIRPVISQGCRLIGERFVVTKAERNLIQELGGEPALGRLHAVFESLSEEERQRANRAVHLGIVIDEHRNRFERGDFLIRNLLGADQTTGAVAVGEVVQEGQTVQFHLRDAASASEEFNALLAADHARHRHPPLGALMFSCCGRGQGLFGKPNHDAGTATARLGSIPLAGFFAQGEIGPVGGRSFLHGYTASLALFAERDR
ncbi:MAG: FIST C-terminal domain-containing protein [Nitrospira sp.]|nr:FIST C-terminal domain-containing protein [Nitrospira sp.]MBX3326404.1 FIST C-terminal domain-containing protein [Nitrospira sp.]